MAKSIKREEEVVVIRRSQVRGERFSVIGKERVLVEGVNMITKSNVKRRIIQRVDL